MVNRRLWRASGLHLGGLDLIHEVHAGVLMGLRELKDAAFDQ